MQDGSILSHMEGSTPPHQVDNFDEIDENVTPYSQCAKLIFKGDNKSSFNEQSLHANNHTCLCAFLKDKKTCCNNQLINRDSTHASHVSNQSYPIAPVVYNEEKATPNMISNNFNCLKHLAAFAYKTCLINWTYGWFWNSVCEDKDAKRKNGFNTCKSLVFDHKIVQYYVKELASAMCVSLSILPSCITCAFIAKVNIHTTIKTAMIMSLLASLFGGIPGTISSTNEGVATTLYSTVHTACTHNFSTATKSECPAGVQCNTHTPSNENHNASDYSMSRKLSDNHAGRYLLASFIDIDLFGEYDTHGVFSRNRFLYDEDAKFLQRKSDHPFNDSYIHGAALETKNLKKRYLKEDTYPLNNSPMYSYSVLPERIHDQDTKQNHSGKTYDQNSSQRKDTLDTFNIENSNAYNSDEGHTSDYGEKGEDINGHSAQHGKCTQHGYEIIFIATVAAGLIQVILGNCFDLFNYLCIFPKSVLFGYMNAVAFISIYSQRRIFLLEDATLNDESAFFYLVIMAVCVFTVFTLYNKYIYKRRVRYMHFLPPSICALLFSLLLEFGVYRPLLDIRTPTIHNIYSNDITYTAQTPIMDANTTQILFDTSSTQHITTPEPEIYQQNSDIYRPIPTEVDSEEDLALATYEAAAMAAQVAKDAQVLEALAARQVAAAAAMFYINERFGNDFLKRQAQRQSDNASNNFTDTLDVSTAAEAARIAADAAANMAAAALSAAEAAAIVAFSYSQLFTLRHLYQIFELTISILMMSSLATLISSDAYTDNRNTKNYHKANKVEDSNNDDLNRQESESRRDDNDQDPQLKAHGYQCKTIELVNFKKSAKNALIIDHTGDEGSDKEDATKQHEISPSNSINSERHTGISSEHENKEAKIINDISPNIIQIHKDGAYCGLNDTVILQDVAMNTNSSCVCPARDYKLHSDFHNAEYKPADKAETENAEYSVNPTVLNKSIYKYDCNKQVIGVGLGNIVCGLCHCIPGSTSLNSSLLNYNIGGRGRESSLFVSIFLYTYVHLLYMHIGHIPLGGLLGLILYTSLHTFRWGWAYRFLYDICSWVGTHIFKPICSGKLFGKHEHSKFLYTCKENSTRAENGIPRSRWQTTLLKLPKCLGLNDLRPTENRQSLLDNFLVILTMILSIVVGLGTAVCCGLFISCVHYCWKYKSQSISVYTAIKEPNSASNTLKSPVKVYFIYGDMFFGNRNEIIKTFTAESDPTEIFIVLIEIHIDTIWGKQKNDRMDHPLCGKYQVLNILNEVVQKYYTYHKHVYIFYTNKIDIHKFII